MMAIFRLLTKLTSVFFKIVQFFFQVAKQIKTADPHMKKLQQLELDPKSRLPPLTEQAEYQLGLVVGETMPA